MADIDYCWSGAVNRADVSRISGISYSTVLKDSKNGALYCFDGKHVTRAECYSYCLWRWQTGRVLMWDLDRIRRRLEDWPTE